MNIALILTDTQRKDMAGAHGQPVVDTPDLDSLLDETDRSRAPMQTHLWSARPRREVRRPYFVPKPNDTFPRREGLPFQ